MENKQNASVVITFANGMQREVKEGYSVVRWFETELNMPSSATVFLNDVSEINVTTDKKFVDEEDAESTKVTLVDGREIEVEEDFDEVNVRWNGAFYGADYEPPVLSLTEKGTGNRLAILAQNIEMLEEL